MKYSTQVKPISYLKSHAAEITLSQTREPLLITQNGEAKLVVMDVQKSRNKRLPCSSCCARREIEEGRTTPATDARIEAMDQEDPA